MKYIDTLNAVDTVKALKLLNLEGNLQGAYVKYPCQKCGKTAVIKAYGSNIISLFIAVSFLCLQLKPYAKSSDLLGALHYLLFPFRLLKACFQRTECLPY